MNSLLPCVLVLFLGVGGDASVDPVVAKEFFQEAKALSDADGGRLWGVELYGPMIFGDPATRAVVANQADAEGKLAAKDGVFVGNLPDSLNVSNTATRWAGVEWTMVAWPLPSDKTARAMLLAHELWHRVQDDLGIAMASPANAHLATAEGRIWLQLEWRALSAALTSSGDAERSAIADALVFRAVRRSLFPKAATEENALEMNEGLAEYTGVVVALPSAKERRTHAEQALKQAEQKESFTRSFAYASGPAYGLLLDAHSPGWRKSIKSAGDLGAALQAALALESPVVDREKALARAGKYRGEALVTKENDRDARKREEIAKLRRRYIDGPTLRLPLAKANISFDPNHNHPLEEGTVYLAARLTDAWGELEAPGGVFVSSDWTYATVPLEDASQPVTSGDGWSLQLSAGWRTVQRESQWSVATEPSTPNP